MNKRNYLVLIFSALALSLSACGSSSSSDTPDTTPPPSNGDDTDNGDNGDTDNDDDDDADNGDTDDNGDTEDNGDSGDDDTNGDDDDANDEDAEPQTYSFYADGLGVLTFSMEGEDVSGALIPGQYSPDDSVVSDLEGTGPDGETVWSVQFNGTDSGNVFLSSEGSAFNYGLMFDSNMQDEGVVHFDLYVEAIDAETVLLVKIDSGWPNLSEYSLEIPEAGEWVSFSLPIADFGPNSGEDGQVNFDKVTNPIVLEAQDGTAIVYMNNIEFSCEVENCGLSAVQPPEAVESGTLDIHMGDLTANYHDLGAWGENITIDTVTDADLGTNVIEFSYSAQATESGIYIGGDAQNLESFAGGEVVFDLKVDNAADNTSGFMIKADHGGGAQEGGGGSADLSIPLPDNNDWNEIRIPLEDYTSSGLDLSEVTAPFVIFPAFHEQANVVFRVGNIRWEAAEEE